MSPEEHEAVLKQPALKAPPGILPQFENPPSMERVVFCVNTVLLVMNTLLFGMRMFVKGYLNRKISVEDYLLGLSWLLYSGGYTVVAYLLAEKLVGAHQWNLTVGELVDFLKTLHVGSILYNIIILPLKISLILQMLRFFVPPRVRNFTYWLSQAFIVMNFVFYVTCTFLFIFACQPQAKIYDPTITSGHCLDSTAILISSATLNTVSDGLMLILPQRVIWDLTLPMKRKIGLSATFFIALLAFIASILRLYFAVQLRESPDFSYHVGWLALWTAPEIAVGFLISCLPFLPKFLHHLNGRQLSANMKSRVGSVFGVTLGNKGQFPGAGLPQTTRTHRQARTAPMVSDVEFDELVVRTSSSTDRQYHGGHTWPYPESLSGEVLPLRLAHPESACAAIVWAGKGGKDTDSQESGALGSDGIKITTDVSVVTE